jgi:hypothetical protein
MRPVDSPLKPSDPIYQSTLHSQTLSADIMKSTDGEIITKLSKFVYSCFEQRLKYLETGSAD